MTKAERRVYEAEYQRYVNKVCNALVCTVDKAMREGWIVGIEAWLNSNQALAKQRAAEQIEKEKTWYTEPLEERMKKVAIQDLVMMLSAIAVQKEQDEREIAELLELELSEETGSGQW